MSRTGMVVVLGVAAGLLMGVAMRAADTPEYLPGGPLAGLKLPPFPTQAGEEPGFPGCIPELAAKGKEFDDKGNTYREYTSQGQPLQVELYPGSVENWRAYWFKYCPVRALYDRQSQLKNWTAPEIPAAGKAAKEEYAAPIYWVPRFAAPVDTGRKNPPVTVYRCKPGAPVFTLDLGTLERGVYVLRVIGAVPTEQLRSFREPLFLEAKVNDGPKGEESFYRVRLGYQDEFYGIGEVFFYASEKRAFKATLTVGAGSKVDLLVRNISLDDVLAGHERAALKTKVCLPQSPRPAFTGAVMAAEARLARDAAIWDFFPPANAQGSMMSQQGDEKTMKDVEPGTADKTAADIAAAFGVWQRAGTSPADSAQRRDAFGDPTLRGVLIENGKLNLRYTMDDLKAHRPLPDPYPVKDDGAGLYFPDPKDPGKGRIFTPIADEIGVRVRDYYGRIDGSVADWMKTGNPDAARDAAVALARYAYAFPTIDYANFLVAVLRDPGPYGREYRCRRRETFAKYMPHYPMYVNPIMYKYDALFAAIKDDQALADSIGRYVPWVKTPKDVIALIDTYFVQTVAKRIMRYHYYTDPMDIGNLAVVVGNPKVTAPWIDWLFSRTFVYPQPVAGIQDLVISGCCRDGCEYIGATYYAQEEGASRVARSVSTFKKHGILPPQFDLTDSVLYPKPVAQCYWRIKHIVGGGNFMRIGDVSGPDKTQGLTMMDLEFARSGWEWTKDPAFAFIVKHYMKRDKETDAEWQAIEKAAATVKRAPWLDNRSRVMPMWAGVLETGHQHDDHRLRMAAYVRLGMGIGHEHNDSLDLQIQSHGLPVTVDGGQRPGYSKPNDLQMRVHNLVTVDDFDGRVHSWARSLADTPGARWLSADTMPPPGTRLYRRQIALVDVDSGSTTQQVPVAQQLPKNDTWGMNTPIVDANAYVFDVFRVGGGKRHTYCFHGPIDDEFIWNAANVAPPTDKHPLIGDLANFGLPEKKLAGTAPETLVVDFRYSRDPKDNRWGNERFMLSGAFREDAPRHYTRLRLMDVKNAPVAKANSHCVNWNFNFSCLMVQKASGAESQDNAFAAIIEPYRGEPFVAGTRLLDVAGNETDAERAVAVEVKLAKGRTDICFADGRPDRVRSVECGTRNDEQGVGKNTSGPQDSALRAPSSALTSLRNPKSEIRISAEAAFVAADAKGPCQGTLVGGTLLEAPGLKLAVAQRERTGTVTKVDYLTKTLWIDAKWPAAAVQPFEVGVPGHLTSYTALKVEPDGEGSRILVENGADYFRAQIEVLDEAKGEVTCAMPLTLRKRPGLDVQWVASNDDRTQFWRADYLDNAKIKLIGAPVTKDSFGKANVLRLWEYGVGDTVRQSTFASVRRVDPAEGAAGAAQWEVTANAAVDVTLPDGRTVKVTEAELAKGGGTVRVGAK